MLGCLILLQQQGDSHDPITTSVTFNKEVVRILQQNCFGCHDVGSQVGISLATYEDARPWAKAIKEEVLEKRMPPFQAVRGYGNFHKSYYLPERDIELLVSWVEGGAPRGEAKDLPKVGDLMQSAATRADLVLRPASAVKIAAGEELVEHCFTLPTGLAGTRWINRLEFQPGNPAAVYSAEFALARNNNRCEGETIGEWVPGQGAIQLPGGTGYELPAGARVVLKIRYRQGNEEITDRSALALHFTKEKNVYPVKAAQIATRPVTIPSGAERHRLKASWTLKEKMEAVAVRPLLYPLGRSVEVTAFRPDGSAEVMVVARNYRYDWQPVYYFREPVLLPAGTRVVVTAYLDNSENNRNLAGESAKATRFAGTLCELLLAKETSPVRPEHQHSEESSANSSGAHKH